MTFVLVSPPATVHHLRVLAEWPTREGKMEARTYVLDPAQENIRWVRGHHADDSEAVTACLAALALVHA